MFTSIEQVHKQGGRCACTYVVSNTRRELYAEAIAVLDMGEARRLLLLRSHEYQVCAVRAIISADRGDCSGAREYAVMALAAAAARHSGLPYHPGIGVVEDPEPAIYEQIRSLAGYRPS